ncbi:MAG: hypothetical protein QN545_10825 [Nitrososphaeraceae archaeon]|nr:hypothetical protein [Nitrososphaeraceae archaeon]
MKIILFTTLNLVLILYAIIPAGYFIIKIFAIKIKPNRQNVIACACGSARETD